MALDLRLAVPVATAWATLCLATVIRTDALPLLLCIGGVLVVAAVAAIGFRRSAVTGVLIMVAVAAAASLLLAIRWSQVPLPPEVPPARCTVEAQLNAGNPLPVAVLVMASECDGAAGPTGEALLIESELDPQDLGFGTQFAAECRTWSFQGTWMLDCVEARVTEQPAFSVWSAAWRAGFREAIAWLPGDGGALLAGLAIGDTSRTDDQLQEAMLDAGLSHLTAVSGANCAIVTGAAFAGATALGARRWLRVAAAVATLVLFAVLVTPEPSVVRASLMAGIALVGLMRGEPRGAVPLVALAVFVALFVNPSLALQAGFVLSVLATTGLIVHSGPIGNALSRYLPRSLGLAIAVPVAAQLWCLPMLIILDNGVQPLSVLWNLAAAPAAPIVTVVGLVACVAAQFTVLLGGLIAAVAWPAAAWIGALARLSDAMPDVRLPWPDGAGGALLATVMVFGTLVALRRRVLGIWMIASACCVGILATTVPQAVTWGALRDWQVIQCDVGQGHATLFRSGPDVVLIDTGPDEEALDACLELASVDRIDAVLLTHFDHDHSGALGAVRGRTDVVLHGPTDDDAQQQLASAGVQTHELHAGQQITVGYIRLEILWPGPESEPGNAASLVIAAHTDADAVAELLVLGDIGAREQRQLRDELPRAEIVLAAHHCSADQDPELYRDVGAPLALVGVGENSYGHPTDSCLVTLEGTASVVLRTDLLGTVAIMRDGQLWSERG